MQKTYRHDLNSRFLRCRGVSLAYDAATLASSISHPVDELLKVRCHVSLPWEAIDSKAVAIGQLPDKVLLFGAVSGFQKYVGLV